MNCINWRCNSRSPNDIRAGRFYIPPLCPDTQNQMPVQFSDFYHSLDPDPNRYADPLPMKIVTATPIDKNRQGTSATLCLSRHCQRKN